MKRMLCLLIVLNLFLPTAGFADDTCVFGVTTDQVPPLVTILLDTGAAMEQVEWHPDYDPDTSYAGDFASDKDYGYDQDGNLAPFETLDTLGTTEADLEAPDSDTTFTINSETITLPAAPGKDQQDAIAVDVDGQGYTETIIDKATRFRFSGNYLNWLFFSGEYSGNGSDLPDTSFLFNAKEALLKVAYETNNKAKFGLYVFNSESGSSQQQPVNEVVSGGKLTNNWVSQISKMGTVDYSPLAEGLATVAANYSSSSVFDDKIPPCTKLFTILVSPGKSSKDQDGEDNNYVPAATPFKDWDGDGKEADGYAVDPHGDAAAGTDVVGAIKWGDGATLDNATGTWQEIPVKEGGSTYLDDMSWYLFDNDIVTYQDSPAGTQNMYTYTIGLPTEEANRRFLINTSNNGNGYKNLYDTSSENYGKYHFDATSPAALASALRDAINNILERTNAFAAPVVPVTRTTSGNRLYMSFFTPKNDTNFWVGNVVKFGLDDDFNIVDKNNNLATEANGALKETAEPFWATIDWADSDNNLRDIFTYMGTDTNLALASNEFATDNTALTAAVLGNPTQDYQKIIKYIRGADAFDEDEDGDVAESRAVITGDVLHSEPLVYEYLFAEGTMDINVVSGTFEADEFIRGDKGGYAQADGTVYWGGGKLNYEGLMAPFSEGETITGRSSGATATVVSVPDKTRIFFGSNDGMLHAVKDEDGKELWGFIPPDQLHRLKDIVEGANHQYFVDSSPKIFLLEGADPDGILDTGEQVILIFGERKGGHSYFALDVTDPDSAPTFLWQLGGSTGGSLGLTNVTGTFQDNEIISSGGGQAKVDGLLANDELGYDELQSPFAVGETVAGQSSGATAEITAVPDTGELGETWSEPVFGRVKTADDDTTGTDVFFVGGGYDPAGQFGRAIYAISVADGTVVRKFTHADMYPVASTVTALDLDNDGFTDVVYVGDTGGQMWRLGGFDSTDFSSRDENIHNWTAANLFNAGCNETDCTNGIDDNGNGQTDEKRKFFYPPTVTQEIGYDLVFGATGDRDDPCENTLAGDLVFAVKDTHAEPPTTLHPSDLRNAGLGEEAVLDGADPGWYRLLTGTGEKVLAETSVFFGIFYFTTFTPDSDPCKPGGEARVYGLDYKTGQAALNSGDTTVLSIEIGGGIPSKPVMVVGETEQRMFISVGSTNAVSGTSGTSNTGPGVQNLSLPGPGLNFYYNWWREIY